MATKAFSAVRLTPPLVHVAGGVLVAVASASFYLAFYAPAAADMAQRTARVEQVHLLMGASDKVARDYRELHDRVAQLRLAAASTRKRMPRRPSTQEFIERITHLAADNNVQVKLCSAAAPQAFPTHTRVEVACDLLGSFDGICRLLADVDQLPQISKVSSLALDTTENSDEYPVSVKFQLYYRPQLHDTELQ